MGHIQCERLLKSKMVCGDDGFTFEIVHVLQFGNELNEELCCRLQIFNNLSFCCSLFNMNVSSIFNRINL